MTATHNFNWVIFNGQLKAKTALVDFFFNSSLLHGNGFFETLLWRDNKLALFNYHSRRFAKTATFFDWQKVPPLSQFCNEKLLYKLINKLEIPTSPLKVRVACFQLNKNWQVVTTIEPYIVRQYPQQLWLPKTPFLAQTPYSNYKTTSYQAYVHAYQQAQKKQCCDQLLVNSDNQVIETATASIFCYFDKQWHTPPLKVGCLAGTRRAFLHEMVFPELGKEVIVATLPLTTLQQSTAIIICNTLLGVIAINKIIGENISSSYHANQAKITQQIIAKYQELEKAV